MQDGLGQREDRSIREDTGGWKGARLHGNSRTPGCFTLSQSIPILDVVVFQVGLLSEHPEVSWPCQISMVMEQEKKDQYEHRCRKMYQGQLL